MNAPGTVTSAISLSFSASRPSEWAALLGFGALWGFEGQQQHTTPASSCGVQRSSRSASSSSSSPTRPWPAMITPCSSIRIGLVKPKDRGLDLLKLSPGMGSRIARIGLEAADRPVFDRKSFRTRRSVRHEPLRFLPAHPGHSSGDEPAVSGPAPGRNCFPTQNASNLASRSLAMRCLTPPPRRRD